MGALLAKPAKRGQANPALRIPRRQAGLLLFSCLQTEII
jgi:hypothetical protein